MSHVSWYIARWRQSFKFNNFFKEFFAFACILWTIIDAVYYIAAQSRDVILANWWLFVISGLVWAIIRCRPKDCFSYKLKGRDAVVEIRVSDITKIQGALVIPVNTTFDTDINGRIMNAQSVQGSFTRKFFKSNIAELDRIIEEQLEKEAVPLENFGTEKPGKDKVYPNGTVVTITRDTRVFYLLASSRINRNGRATGEQHDLRIALEKLWIYIRESGDKSTIAIPVIGTGNARLPISRDDVVRMIIKSYVNSCGSKTYCEKLIIVIHPQDVEKYKINLNDLDAFLKYSCDYVDFENRQIIGEN